MNLPILKNRYVQLGASFVLGGVVTVLFLPQIIKREKEVQIVEKEKIVVETVVKEVIVEREKAISEKVRVVHQKETRPDGTVIEYELYESEMEQIERIRQEEKNKYELALAEKSTEFHEREKELRYNADSKKFTIYGGYMGEDRYMLGTSYRVWGPLSMGLAVNSNKGVSILPTVGVTF